MLPPPPMRPTWQQTHPRLPPTPPPTPSLHPLVKGLAAPGPAPFPEPGRCWVTSEPGSLRVTRRGPAPRWTAEVVAPEISIG